MQRRLRAAANLLGFGLTILLAIQPGSAGAQLPIPGSVSGTLQPGQGLKYSFKVPKDGDVGLTLTTDAPHEVLLSFIDSDGVTVRLQIGATTGHPGGFNIPHLGPGATYYADAYSVQDSCSFTITAKWHPQAIANDKELNDTPATAKKTLPAKGKVTGHLGYSRTSWSDQDQIDYYKFTPPSDGDLTITLKPTSTLATRLYLFDTDGMTEIALVNAARGQQSTVTLPHVGPQGTYYVAIQTGNFSQGDDVYGGYTLKTSFSPQTLANDIEPNDTLATAEPFPPSGTTTGHLGYSRISFANRDGDDCYSFSANAGTVGFTLALTSGLAVNWYIEDSNGNNLGQGSVAAGSSGSLSANIPTSGTYYVVLFTAFGGGDYWGGYTLTKQ